MVYLDGNPNLGAMGVHYPRRRYLTGLAAYNPRQRHLHGMGCGCGGSNFSCTCGPRMISALGDDIPAPNIGPDTSAPSSPGLFTDYPSSGPVAPAGAPYGPTTPYGIAQTMPQNVAAPPAPVLPASALAMPAAPAISYGSPAAALTAMGLPSTGAVPIFAAAPSSPPGTVFGIPTQYLMYGGLAILGLSVLGGGKKGRR